MLKQIQTILLRLDLNVPFDKNSNSILETEKIEAVIPEIKKLAEKNKVIVISHLGKGEKKDSIRPIAEYIRNKLSKKINDNLTILENTRWLPGETTKENSKEFLSTSRFLAEMGDKYINDAFAALHRPHASIIGIPKIFREEKYKNLNKKNLINKIQVGQLVKFEIKNLNKNLNKIKKEKTLIILSGSKISAKLPLIKKFLINENVRVFVSGGIANQILKDVLNYNIGLSFFEINFQLSAKEKEFLQEKIVKGRLILPIDVLLQDNQEKHINAIHLRDRIVDLGRESISTLKSIILENKNIIFNGPLGIYEEGFTVATKEILESLKELAIKNQKVLITIGGSDTLIFIKKLRITSVENIFISTGGGAMLEYLANDGDLPGLKVLQK